MVAKTDTLRQTSEAERRNLIRFQRLAHTIVKGVRNLDRRALRFSMILLLSLLGCAGSETKDIPPEAPSPECDSVGTFLGGEAVRATDLALVREKAEKILARNKSISMQSCAAHATLERLVRQIEARFPTDAASVAERSATEKLAQSIIEKSDAFKWQLPGDKKVGTRATYLKRLGYTTDRSKRQSIYKLFNSSRSRRWLQWGFKDLVAQRNKEAQVAGFQSYPEYVLKRNGQNYAQIMKMLEALQERLGPFVRRQLLRSADSSGIAGLEPWDLYFLMEKDWGINPTKPFPPNAPADYARVFMNGLGLNDADPATFIIDNPVVKTDFGSVAGKVALESYVKHIKQPIVIFQRPSESSKEAIYESLKWLALDSPLLLPSLKGETQNMKPPGYAPLAWNAYRYAWLFAFEKRMYEQPEADYFELWSSVSREFWGIEVPTFYGGFDEEEYLKAPASLAEKALGAVTAVGIVESGYQQFSENLGPGFGEGLKRDWFPPGSEVLTLDLLRKFSKENWSTKDLIDLLVASLNG